MATRKQKQELIDTLKFVPHSVEISVSGYGGEIVLGRVARETYDYWTAQGRDALTEYVTAWGDDEYETAPKIFRFVEPGAWYDCDDVGHASGAEMHGSSGITVIDPRDDSVLFECELVPEKLTALGIQVEQVEDIDIDNFEPGTTLFVGQSVEKGVFFSGSVDLTQPFDPKRMTIQYARYHGWPIMTSLEYDGEDVDGTDGISTRGKSMDFEMISADSNECDDWDLWNIAARDLSRVTEWIRMDQHVPVYEGEYQVRVGSTLYPDQFAVWRDQKWQYDNGVPVVLPIVAWRGVDYPTC
jgi:hypothetical protein